MTDSHLLNARRLIERKAEEGFMIGGGDTWDVDSLWAEECHDPFYFEGYGDIVDEIKRRKI